MNKRRITVGMCGFSNFHPSVPEVRRDPRFSLKWNTALNARQETMEYLEGIPVDVVVIRADWPPGKQVKAKLKEARRGSVIIEGEDPHPDTFALA